MSIGLTIMALLIKHILGIFTISPAPSTFENLFIPIYLNKKFQMNTIPSSMSKKRKQSENDVTVHPSNDDKANDIILKGYFCYETQRVNELCL